MTDQFSERHVIEGLVGEESFEDQINRMVDDFDNHDGCRVRITLEVFAEEAEVKLAIPN